MSAGYTPLRQDPLPDRERSATAAEIDRQISDIFIKPQIMDKTARTVKSEIDDSDTDDRPVVSGPYPGVDDGFFDRGNKSAHPEVEKFDPNQPVAPVPGIEVTPGTPDYAGNIPSLMPRLGPDDDNTPGDTGEKKPDTTDTPGGTTNVDRKGGDRPPSLSPNRPNFPTPSFGFDMEAGSIPAGFDSIPDVNIYQHKKTLAQGMMDLALFSANANQLRYVLESFNRHPYYYASFSLIVISLLLQVAVGVGLIWNATYNVKDKVQICFANRINNFTIIGIFLVTVINVFISAFGVANSP